MILPWNNFWKMSASMEEELLESDDIRRRRGAPPDAGAAADDPRTSPIFIPETTNGTQRCVLGNVLNDIGGKRTWQYQIFVLVQIFDILHVALFMCVVLFSAGQRLRASASLLLRGKPREQQKSVLATKCHSFIHLHC